MRLKTAKGLPREYDLGVFRRLFLTVDDAVNKLTDGLSFAVTKTASFSLQDSWIICNGSGSITVTLPNPVTYTGVPIHLKTIAAFTVVSASANVVPLIGGAAGTAILAATAGKWATLVSNGTNWVIMEGN